MIDFQNSLLLFRYYIVSGIFSCSLNWSCKLQPRIDQVTKASQQIHKFFNYVSASQFQIKKFLYILLNYPTLDDHNILSFRSLLQFQQGNNEV